jgi:hypothetical protein
MWITTQGKAKGMERARRTKKAIHDKTRGEEGDLAEGPREEGAWEKRRRKRRMGRGSHSGDGNDGGNAEDDGCLVGGTLTQ